MHAIVARTLTWAKTSLAKAVASADSPGYKPVSSNLIGIPGCKVPANALSSGTGVASIDLDWTDLQKDSMHRSASQANLAQPSIDTVPKRGVHMMLC